MLKIYGVPISVHTRKVIIAAIEKKLAFENEPVIPFNPPAGWDKLSPTGKIPVVAIDDFELADSSVISAYLEQTHPEPALYPREAKERARALWLEEYCDSTLFREVVHGLFFQNVIRPKILQQPTDRAAIDAILTQSLPKVFGYLESQMTDGYLVANRIDAARYPKLERSFKRLCQHPSIATALRTELPVAKNMGLDLTAIDAMLAHA